MEIKKMGKAYTEIAEGVLPKLRRSAISINGEKVGRSDEQIAALAKSNPDSLSVEEILYAGTLTQDLNENSRSTARHSACTRKEWRAANNTGMILFQQGDVDGAMAEFNKADQLNANNGIVKNNIGACYSRKGDRANAAAAYAAAGNAGPEVKRTWVSSISATVTTVLLYLTTPVYLPSTPRLLVCSRVTKKAL